MLRWPKLLGFAVFILLASGQLNAQNTKGDRPAASNKKETRQTRFKVKSKQGDKAKTKDIAGRRLRTKNKSSANKANASYPQPRTATRSPRQGRDRASEPIRPIYSSSPRDRDRKSSAGKPAKRVEVRSVSSAASRRNVYPQKNVRSVSSQSSKRNVYSQRSNPYVNNSSRKPKDPQGISGSRPQRRVQVRSVSAKSSRQNVYSNRGNRYVNNPSRKPRDTQRSSARLAAGNKVQVRSTSSQIKRQSLSGKQGGAFKNYQSPVKQRTVSNKRELARLQANRSRPISSKRIGSTPKSSSRAFIRHKGLNPFVGFFSLKKKEGDVSGKDLAGRTLRMRNFQSPAQAVIKPTTDPKSKRPKGDRAYKGPAAGSYKSATRTQPKAWSGDLSGRKIRGRNFESKKGGSNAPVYAPKLAKAKVGDHPKNKSIGGFRSYSGNYVGKVGLPIPVRPPGKRAEKTARYQSKLNGRRVISGGGSVSGKKWNNNGQPISPRQPGIGIRNVNYAGNLKANKPLKGGGSVSGKLWNNNGLPISPRQPGIGIKNVNYAGNLKASKPLKGGGSV
ncbi:MAG: hypothetical protein EBU52_18035, partial [Cytophagia bacterium]|nr:hypothetical protein [Cytophagia bacterium]